MTLSQGQSHSMDWGGAAKLEEPTGSEKCSFSLDDVVLLFELKGVMTKCKHLFGNGLDTRNIKWHLAVGNSQKSK